MDTSGTAQEHAMPQVDVGHLVCPLLRSFFKGMTKEQWRLMESGTPDDATVVMMAETVCDVTATLTNAILKSLVNTTVVPAGLVKSILDGKVAESFAESLDVEDPVQCTSSAELTDLIAEDVTASVQNALHSPVGIPQRLTSPVKLETMTCRACELCKIFAGKIKAVFSPQPQKQRSRSTTSKETTEESENLEKISSDPVTETEKVAEVIRNELNEIIDPFLVDVPDFEYELLQSQRSQEIDAVAVSIIQTLAEDKMDGTNAAGSPPTEQPHKSKHEDVGSKIKTLFKDSFSKSWIHRSVAKLNDRFPQDSKVESRKSMQSRKSLTDKLDDLLEKQELAPHKTIPGDQVLTFTEALCDLLYKYLTNGDEIIREPFRKGLFRRMQVPVPPEHAAMFADLQKTALSFLTMTRWWQMYQAYNHTKRLTDTIMATESEVIDIRENEALAATRKLLSVKILVEQLVSRTLRTAKIFWTTTDTNAVIERLFDGIWAEVKEVDFDITPKTFNNLDETIFQDLCEKWGSAEMVLVSLISGEPELGDHIASSVRAHLMTPPKQGCSIGRFFSSVGRDFSNVFRRGRGRVDVM